MKYDVFISYSSLDQKVAEGVCAYLEQHRIRCFISYRDIPKGVVWASAIVDALDESRMMVVVFSGNFNRSEQVDREIELASEDKKPILTFRISNDTFKGAKKYYLKNLNWIDAFPNPEECFGNLCENVAKLLGLKDITDPAQQGQLNIDLNPIDPDEQCSLARRYQNGDGVPQDDRKAVYWYHKAAEQGYATAQFELGVRYHCGLGIYKDKQQTVYWYRKAAEQGHIKAQANLGDCYQYGWGISEDFQQAVEWHRKAAEQGDVDAQFDLGFIYQYMDISFEDPKQAFYWYSKAAEQGHSFAQYCLGYCFLFGYGVVKDSQQAVYWYRKAAEQGLVDAQTELGNCYKKVTV